MAKTTKTSTKHKTTKRVKKAVPIIEEAALDTDTYESTNDTSTSYDFSQKASVSSPTSYNPSTNKFGVSTVVLLVLTALISGVLVYTLTNPGLPLAAIVNGQPIFRWDLHSVLNSRYGQQTLEGMITERLITSEASKQNVTVSQSDVDNRAKEILASFGSAMSVDDFLKLQGINREEFNNQLKLQLQVQKLLTKDLSISDSDVANYIASNAAVLTATDPAKLKEEAISAMTDEHVSSRFNEWLEEIRAKATVQQFL